MGQTRRGHIALLGLLLFVLAIVGIPSLIQVRDSLESLEGMKSRFGGLPRDLHCIFPEAGLEGSVHWDAIPTLTHPDTLPAAQAGYMRPRDRVIGVRFGTEAVAYPINILQHHECVNATVGGKEIAVTYCPLCDSSFVFDRQVDGEVLEFGNSGMLFNSNVVLYDRRPRTEEASLWSQITMSAICGPAAEKGRKLTLLPSEVTAWEDWIKRNPQTRVLSIRTGHIRDYANSHYTQYFESNDLPQRSIVNLREDPRPQGIRGKERALIVRIGDKMRAYPFGEVARVAGEVGAMTDEVAGTVVALEYNPKFKTLRAESIEPQKVPIPTATSFWFALASTQHDFDVFDAD